MAALANASLDRALQLDPQLSDVWWVKLHHLQQGSAPTSYRIDSLKDALVSNPNDAELLFTIARLTSYRVSVPMRYNCTSVPTGPTRSGLRAFLASQKSVTP